MGILGFRKFIGKIVFPVLLKFLFGKQYLSKRKSMKEKLRCVHILKWPALYSWILCISQWTGWKLFIFQSEVKILSRTFSLPAHLFLYISSLYLTPVLFSFLTSNTFYEDFVTISETCHLNITVHPYSWVITPLCSYLQNGILQVGLAVVTFLWQSRLCTWSASKLLEKSY